MSAKGTIVYLTLENIMRLHERSIESYGGSAGVRDIALVEAAVGRHQSGYYEGRIEEAAALMESLLQNHPFIDGNKRTAFLAADVFLRGNGYKISADSMVVYKAIIGLMERQEVSHETLLALLREITENVDE
ncbi:MAG: type II toxin-antitoxin system death-on-curing family toxin [Gammaproteobacteria bacterium]